MLQNGTDEILMARGVGDAKIMNQLTFHSVEKWQNMPKMKEFCR